MLILNKEKTDILSELKRFYTKVDEKVEVLKKRHTGRLRCGKGCSACCIDEITVFEIEAENIKLHHAELLENEKPHDVGKCAFLDENGACRIYENRPYVCRTQGLPLRWLDEENWIEYRDICYLNETDEPIENLAVEECWTIGVFESWLASLQVEFGNGQMNRVSLRGLFRKVLENKVRKSYR